MQVVPVSQSQAQQRTGRAGREAPGSCYRLYQEQAFLQMELSTPPEIQRVDLCQVVLQLKVIGVHRVHKFDYLSAPSQTALVAALKLLFSIGALDSSGALTAHGKSVAALPLAPVFSHLVLLSSQPEFACTAEVLGAVSCLSADNVFYTPAEPEQRRAAAAAHRAFASVDGDLPCLAAVLEAYRTAASKKGESSSAWCKQRYLNARSLARAMDIRTQLARILRTLGIDPDCSCGAERQRMLRSIAKGLHLQVAVRQPTASSATSTSSSSSSRHSSSSGTIARASGGCYRTMNGGREVYLHPTSCLFNANPPPHCLVYTEVLETSRQFIKWVTKIEPAWLSELAPTLYGGDKAISAQLTADDEAA
jgi:ATP-dependent RNA helicase DHX8/PRP22